MTSIMNKALVFATGNKGKLREAQEILGKEFDILSPAEVGVDPEVEETGTTLKSNSIIKAEHLYSLCGKDCFADDTGLEVDALGGAPGVYTARYAGLDCDFDDNMDKILRELAALGPDAPRTARFRCVVTLILDGRKHFFEGVMEGEIALRKSGYEGFGYDPVFIPSRSAYENAGETAPEQALTIAELGEDLKNRISHRARALELMSRFLAPNPYRSR